VQPTAWKHNRQKSKDIQGEDTMPPQRHAGPSLLALTLVYVALMFVGGANVKVAFKEPHDSAMAAAFVAQNIQAIRLGSFCEFVSAISLGLFMAISISWLRFQGTNAVGEHLAALGGIATPIMLTGSAMATWSLTRPGVAAPGAVEALQSMGFDGGGPGFAVFFGLFVAGVSVAAGMHRRIPRWLLWLGIAVAAAGELSSLTLLNFKAGYFIPVLRFLSIFWMLGLAMNLPTASPVSGTTESGHSAPSNV
jgi:hypothetical protein